MITCDRVLKSPVMRLKKRVCWSFQFSVQKVAVSSFTASTKGRKVNVLWLQNPTHIAGYGNLQQRFEKSSIVAGLVDALEFSIFCSKSGR